MTRRDYPPPGQPIDWCGEVITPQERAAYARGLADGIRKAWWRVAAGYVLASVFLIIAFHALGLKP